MPGRLGLALALVLGAGPLAAQSPGEPLSAIDWLSDVVRTPAPVAPAEDISEGVDVEPIAVAPLGALAVDGVGLVPASVSGLPRDFWGPTATADLVRRMAALGPDLPDPARALLFRIVLAELGPPVDASADHGLFLARIDTLLRFGALDEAQALLERAGPTEPDLFRRWFDISLLIGTEDRACAAMRAAPDIAPTFSARIFCLARGGDWSAAALSLETAKALGFVSGAEETLLSRFLDPVLAEELADLPPPTTMTPLTFRMLAALGEAPSVNGLPVAFSHAVLAPTEGWRLRLEAAERLARSGGLAETRLFAAYTERRPAASGGVWERVELVQALDAALIAGDAGAVTAVLPQTVDAMRRVGLLPVLARHYGARIAQVLATAPPSEALDAVYLLSPEAERLALAGRIGDPMGAALARGLEPDRVSDDALAVALAAGFAPLSSRLEARSPAIQTAAEQLQSGRLGEVVLETLGGLSRLSPDPGDVETALWVLRRVGLEQVARDVALALWLAPDPVR